MPSTLRRLLVWPLLCGVLVWPLLGQVPRIDSIEPTQGPIAGGTVVTIKGANFLGAELTVDKAATAAQVLSATEIRFTTAAHNNGIASLKIATAAGVAYGEFLFIPPRLEDLPPGYITTIVGIGQFTGLYRQATQAMVDPVGLAYDPQGNLYIAETNQDRVVRIRPDGVIEPFAGSGTAQFAGTSQTTGDGGPAIEASINFPRGVTTDAAGFVYIVDQQRRIRRIDTRTGIITTIAGTGVRGFSGDGGPAVQARLTNPTHIAGDGQGTLYFIDHDDTTGGVRIRKITPDGIISTIAGSGIQGFAGDGGPATQARFDLQFSDLGAIAIDAQSHVYIADTGNRRIRRIDAQTGIVTTVTGPNSSAGGQYAQIYAITADRQNNLYFAEWGHIWRITPTGQVLTMYGRGIGFSADGTPLQDMLLPPGISDLTLDSAGNLLFSDRSYFRVRRLNFATGVLETVAGIGPRCIGETDHALAAAPFKNANGDLAFLPSGEMLFGNQGNFVLRRLETDGRFTTIAGTGAALWNVADGRPATEVSFSPLAIKPDASGRIYLSDMTNILRLDPDGLLRLVANIPSQRGFSGDGGPARQALLCQPWDVAVDADNNVFIADTNNNRIRRVDAQTGIITTVAGSGPVNGFEHYGIDGQGSYSGDGGPAVQACLNTPLGVVVDRTGNLYIADTSNYRIRKVDPAGNISTFTNSYAGASKLALDPAGRPYGICQNRLWRYHASGMPTLIAGQSTGGFSGDGGPASQAQLYGGIQSTGITIDAAGNIFFFDGLNRRIRAIRHGALLEPPVITARAAAARITAGQPAIFAVAATGYPAPTFQWKKNGAVIAGATGSTYTLASAQAADAANYSVTLTNMMGTATSAAAALTVVSTPTAPGIAAPPLNQTINEGTAATFTILANGNAPLSYQWQKDGTAIAGATDNGFRIASALPDDAGTYSCVVTNASGSVTSAAATLAVQWSRLINLSVRSTAGTGSEALIAGFVVSGETGKPLLLRGIGPTLGQYGLAGALADPVLTLYSDTGTQLSINDDWGAAANFAEIAGTAARLNTFALPNGSRDAALLTVLGSGAYTAQASGKANATGIALIEAYDTAGSTGARLINVSARTRVGTGAEVLVVGFVIAGNSPQPLLLRAVGPTLAGLGVTGVLADPQLALFRQGTTVPIQQNDDWRGTAPLKAAFAATGAFDLPDASKDAALLVTLEPGSYSAQVSGVNNTTGVALVEVYAVP
ncbi:MAG: immunoglobulin domain-containing protein [Opitutae bacterium]|nr:immunoglobulin domain-containing protein [Opitutae bacterium]